MIASSPATFPRGAHSEFPPVDSTTKEIRTVFARVMLTNPRMLELLYIKFKRKEQTVLPALVLKGESRNY